MSATVRTIIACTFAIILAIGVAAYLIAPRYQVVNIGEGGTVRANLRTGEMVECHAGVCEQVASPGDMRAAARSDSPPPPPGYILDPPPNNAR